MAKETYLDGKSSAVVRYRYGYVNIPLYTRLYRQVLYVYTHTHTRQVPEREEKRGEERQRRRVNL